MSFNLLVWKWSPDFDTPAKRKKRKLAYPALVAAFQRDARHAAMAEHDFADFEDALVDALGPEVVDGPYILERHACARVINLPASRVRELVPQIGQLARSCGLTSAES